MIEVIGYEGYYDAEKHVAWGAAAFVQNGRLHNGVSGLTREYSEASQDLRSVRSLLPFQLNVVKCYVVVETSQLLENDLTNGAQRLGIFDDDIVSAFHTLTTDYQTVVRYFLSQGTFDAWRFLAVSLLLDDPGPPSETLDRKIHAAAILSWHHPRVQANMFRLRSPRLDVELERRLSVASLRPDSKHSLEENIKLYHKYLDELKAEQK
jgi:hypothetical protein